MILKLQRLSTAAEDAEEVESLVTTADLAAPKWLGKGTPFAGGGPLPTGLGEYVDSSSRDSCLMERLQPEHRGCRLHGCYPEGPFGPQYVPQEVLDRSALDSPVYRGKRKDESTVPTTDTSTILQLHHRLRRSACDVSVRMSAF